MITCPECGQPAPDNAKFCERCGQGLDSTLAHPAAPAIEPLPPGTELAHGYRIVELMRRNSRENRYQAERTVDGESRIFYLRERPGPSEPMQAANGLTADPAAAEEDPAGPRAKTAELKRERISAEPSGGNGSRISDGAANREQNSKKSDAEQHDETKAAGANVRTPGSDPVLPESTEEAVAETGASSSEEAVAARAATIGPDTIAAAEQEAPAETEDLGEVFGRVQALSLTLNHPALERAVEGFAENGRVYLAYPEERLTALADRAGGLKMEESEAIAIALQICQAVSFMHRRGLRVNDICPSSVAIGADGRARLTGLDYVSNDNEMQADAIFNDGYTAPEIYKGKKVDKRADVFSIGAVLYSCLTGERLEAESWREEAGPIRFYPPHVVTPGLEQAVRQALAFDPGARWQSVDAFKAELLRLSGTINLRAAALTDVGMVRELNEDALMTLEYRRDSQVEPAAASLYVIADGMGGAAAGEIASAIAVGTIREQIEGRLDQVTASSAAEILREALEAANRAVLDYQTGHAEARGMGSTAVAVLITPPDAAIAWVGDSRAYLSQTSGLRQLSKDHSLVQRLIEIGQITADEARHHEHKNVITRSLGARPQGPAGAEALTIRLKRGDRVLLCSDGLTTHVEDSAIAEILRRHSDPSAAARELIVAANAGGGTDNISVVVILAGG